MSLLRAFTSLTPYIILFYDFIVNIFSSSFTCIPSVTQSRASLWRILKKKNVEKNVVASLLVPGFRGRLEMNCG